MPHLRGRRSECQTLDRLLAAARDGRSGAIVLRGEAGVGKTALLQYLGERADGCRVARAAGVQSEMELAFAGLHQLCAPMLDRAEGLPEPQREALGTAFGLGGRGGPPDRFFVGLAVLGLLAEVAGEQPLVCLIDDAQWLDVATAQALAFVGRRLSAESVAVVFAARSEPKNTPLAGLPELEVAGLRDDDARELLASVLPGPLDERVRDRIVAETRGNPLALLELPRGLKPAELAGGFGLPDALALSGRIEESFARRVEELPEDTRRLLLIAAADPVGEPLLVWRAGERLGVGIDAAVPAEAADLLETGARMRFRHPLVRSAVYRSASPQERRRVHAALAEATDPEVDPDRRAWHRAHAAEGPDEDVAQELEHSAGRAQARGGLAAEAAFHERAAALTPDPERRADRALAAASAMHRAGAPDAALRLLATAEAGGENPLRRAKAELLRAQITFAVNRGSEAPPQLLRAAKRLAPLDPELARETYLDALLAATFAGGGGVMKVAQAAPRSAGASRAPDLLLEGLAVRITEGYAAGVPILKRALRAFAGEDDLRWHWLACHTAHELWDDETWVALATRHLQLARDRGLLADLPLALIARLYMHLYAGELATAASLIEEVEAVVEATGSRLAPYGALELAALRGREADVRRLIEGPRGDAASRGEGMGVTLIRDATALLYNGLGRFGDAYAAARRSREHAEELGTSTWALPELIEAAARSGHDDVAAEALGQLCANTQAAGTDWALGIEARSRALVEGDEECFAEAISRLERTRVQVELARAHLLYGEWLSVQRRRADARDELRAAHARFVAMGAEGFAARAAAELGATGETVHRFPRETSAALTPQEAQIAKLASEGLSNPEIGARLFLSPRTVEYHLHKVFAKLEISSRQQLPSVLEAV
jgi:DNA-binding CsgD family transcriptional regulator